MRGIVSKLTRLRSSIRSWRFTRQSSQTLSTSNRYRLEWFSPCASASLVWTASGSEIAVEDPFIRRMQNVSWSQWLEGSCDRYPLEKSASACVLSATSFGHAHDDLWADRLGREKSAEHHQTWVANQAAPICFPNTSSLIAKIERSLC